MTVYSVDKGKTHFSQDFSQVFCTFSYSVDEQNSQKYFGAFVADINWAGYFYDPVLSRYLQVKEGDSWLEAMDPDMAIVNDIFYNKLIEYMSLAKGKFGAAIEIDDEDFEKMEDDVDYDAQKNNLFTDQQEVEIFNAMFSNADFIEDFKDELDNPAKYNLVSAIMYIQKNAPIETTGDADDNKLKKYLEEV